MPFILINSDKHWAAVVQSLFFSPVFIYPDCLNPSPAYSSNHEVLKVRNRMDAISHALKSYPGFKCSQCRIRSQNPPEICSLCAARHDFHYIFCSATCCDAHKTAKHAPWPLLDGSSSYRAEVQTRLQPVSMDRSSTAETHFQSSKERNPELKLRQIVVESQKTKLKERPLGSTETDASEICTGDSIIIFKCPLSLVRIEHPAKGKQCQHQQVFDAEKFLQFNEKRSTWKCPVCTNQIQKQDLILDAEMLRLLTKYPDSDKCIVKENGEDSAFVETQSVATVQMENAPISIQSSKVVIDLDDDFAFNPIHVTGEKRKVAIDLCDSDDDGTNLVTSRPKVDFLQVEEREVGGKIVRTFVID
ncbi:zf-MIZ-domain-containing protein [Rhizoclosmatium globosum]|uniref:Zf-MIZ-domain-containing protein n=1 Tax=Rhizoclosmatium globosum TaxID=329046 RepID=A0A1Y2BC60_9FUNG|nr:zf-MIZ-domain-containing protein [Rhizoclosmatium globosum]|eukprot:ORY32418.1 zf-MIZ-domain-containing protein [Rhizoclosmatium globosum]